MRAHRIDLLRPDFHDRYGLSVHGLLDSWLHFLGPGMEIRDVLFRFFFLVHERGDVFEQLLIASFSVLDIDGRSDLRILFIIGFGDRYDQVRIGFDNHFQGRFGARDVHRLDPFDVVFQKRILQSVRRGDDRLDIDGKEFPKIIIGYDAFRVGRDLHFSFVGLYSFHIG